MARPTATQTPRRITRSSLARFAYTNTPDGPKAPAESQESHDFSPDIEDAVPDLPSPPRKRKRVITARKVKEEASGDDKPEIPPEAISTRQRKAPRKTADRAAKPTTPTPAPPNWEEIYTIVQSMRSEGGAAFDAPVDTMGCERLALASASPRDQRFQTLVALMLSSQTKDTVNAIAMRRLQSELGPPTSRGLNLENVLAASPTHLNSLIRAVGFHNNKTRYLQQAAAICRDEHDGDIPSTIAGLVSLPGVGPKMAHLCLSAAWGRTEGIGVDVHVHRITNLWGWHGKGGSKNPEDTRAKLESWLPRDKWREINTLLVGLGQTVCAPLRPRCGDCEVGLRGLCRAADRKKVLEGRRLRENGSGAAASPGEAVVKSEEEKIKVEEKA
ncbi:DNA glycosylase [Xylaria nigripes]|nr:DNA glycosylase [Xylaria nigripes]